MPNWCMTNVDIICKDVKEATVLYKNIEKWTSHNYCDNDFGNDWLGNIVGNSGIDNPANENSVRCRGRLCYLDLNNNEVSIDTETAWGPMIQMWDRICKKYLTEYEIIYSAEESGCGVYFTNDPNRSGKYLVDSINDEFTEKFLCGESYDPEVKESYLRKLLQKCLNTSENNIKKLLKKFETYEHGYDDVYITPWEYVPISDLV